MTTLVGLLLASALAGALGVYQTTRLKRLLVGSGWAVVATGQYRREVEERVVVLNTHVSARKPCWVVSTELLTSPLASGQRLVLERLYFPHATWQVMARMAQLTTVKAPPTFSDAFKVRASDPEVARGIIEEPDFIGSVRYLEEARPRVGTVVVEGRDLSLLARRHDTNQAELDGLLALLEELARELEDHDPAEA